MEENNRKGPGVFYAVVGVATLVVAIIGATFAYFSAAATPTGDTIQGETNNIKGSNLTLTVTKLFGLGNGAASDSLVPAEFDDTELADINKAITSKCVNAGYTGCHVYDIKIKSDQTISEADLLLDLEVTPTGSATKENWKYLVFQQSDTSTSTLSAATTITKSATSLDDDANDVELHERNKPTTTVGLTQNTEVHYFLMVYLKNVNKPQNADPAVSGESLNELGTYSGSVQLQAMGGQVKATFTAA